MFLELQNYNFFRISSNQFHFFIHFFQTFISRFIVRCAVRRLRATSRRLCVVAASTHFPTEQPADKNTQIFPTKVMPQSRKTAR